MTTQQLTRLRMQAISLNGQTSQILVLCGLLQEHMALNKELLKALDEATGGNGGPVQNTAQNLAPADNPDTSGAGGTGG